MSQVEKEIKFSPDQETLDGLVTGQPEEIVNRDVYQGFPDIKQVKYPLVQQDAWLRNRNGEYELKIVSGDGGPVKVSEELPADEVDSRLSDLLARKGVSDHDGLDDPRLESLVYVRTARKRFEENAETPGVDVFHVDVDHVTFWESLEYGWQRPGEPSLHWNIAEIDITADGRAAAKKEISRVVENYGLSVHDQRKIMTYLQRDEHEALRYIPK